MKTSIALSAFLLAAGAACAADTPGASPSVPQPSVQERLANARKAVDRKDWSTAQRELTVVVREAPQNADAHNLLGYTYRKRGSPDMARAYEHYDMALKIDPRHKGAREYLGEAYLVDRRLSDAERQLVELEKICGGPACEEYRDLAKSIADYKARQ